MDSSPIGDGRSGIDGDRRLVGSSGDRHHIIECIPEDCTDSAGGDTQFELFIAATEQK